MKEHKSLVFHLDNNSLFAERVKRTDHELDSDNTTIVDQCQLWFERLLLETWHSIKNKNYIDLHIQPLAEHFQGCK